ncbi:MAG: hypothetical protein M3N52_04495 [Actinomycetota bacterium]|nr:hypothetical protein [Actinomycetota bacterium]
MYAVDGWTGCQWCSWSPHVARRSPRAGDLLARIGSSPRARRLRLQPLGERALGALAAARLGRAVDAELCHGLWRATGGNPFLAHQLLAVLGADGVPDTADGPGALVRLAPQGVTDAILGRLAAEGGTAERLAEAVAILGETDLTAAAALAGLAEADAVAAADHEAVIVPVLAAETPGLMQAFPDGAPWRAYVGVVAASGTLVAVGFLLFGATMYRAAILPRWAITCACLGAAAAGLQFFLPRPAATLAFVTLGVGLTGLGQALWTSVHPPRPRPATTGPAAQAS